MNTLVGIVMGSDSDLARMSEAAKTLQELGIESELRVLSAHRTPRELTDWIRSIESRGAKVFIAAAGLAAALPGTVAAHTALPVVGVPLSSSASAAGGLDAILAIVQMPPGVPVATVALNGAKNAAILAAQIIGAGNEDIRTGIAAYKEKMSKEIVARDRELQENGYKKYLEDHAS